MQHSNLRRKGLSVVELLVAITIIGLLLALLLPAIQAVRGQQRHVQCRNNLRQLIFASQSYESGCGVFPNRILMTFQCPADIVSSTTPRSSGYVVDFGSCSRPLPECDGFGTESDNVYRKSRDVIDGMSTTVAYGEKLLPPSYAGQSGLDLTAGGTHQTGSLFRTSRM